MATKPKPKPEPDPPEPPEGDDAAVASEAMPDGVSMLDRVENLEHRMDAIEERVKAPPIGLGRRP